MIAVRQSNLTIVMMMLTMIMNEITKDSLYFYAGIALFVIAIFEMIAENRKMKQPKDEEKKILQEIKTTDTLNADFFNRLRRLCQREVERPAMAAMLMVLHNKLLDSDMRLNLMELKNQRMEETIEGYARVEKALIETGRYDENLQGDDFDRLCYVVDALILEAARNNPEKYQIELAEKIVANNKSTAELLTATEKLAKNLGAMIEQLDKQGVASAEDHGKREEARMLLGEYRVASGYIFDKLKKES